MFEPSKLRLFLGLFVKKPNFDKHLKFTGHVMICIKKPGNNPLFNIAAEEFVTKHISQEVLMLWENDWCVVVGKHQLPFAEVNPSILFEPKVPVLRRISGGGTVVHAPGNLNYTFVTDNSFQKNKIDFLNQTKPIASFLHHIGLKVQLTAVSNLTVADLKISGNAAHVFKNRSLHHGTLLFNADLQKLVGLIHRKDRPYTTKAIPSNYVKVANISELMHEKMSFDEFKESLQKYLLKQLCINEIRPFEPYEIEMIQRLVEEKYSSSDWNFGYSPDYHFEKAITFRGNEVYVSFQVSRGRIRHFDINGCELLKPLEGFLRDVAHSPKSFSEKLTSFAQTAVISEIEINQLLFELF